MLPEGELSELANDIKTNGLKEKIWLYEGKILDGRNRWLACKQAGVEPKTTDYTGDTPASFVLSLNLHRRHLTPSQKATVAVEILPWFEREAKKRQATSTGGSKPQLRPKLDKADRSDALAGQALGVGRSYVSDAKAIKQKAPQLFQQVKAGEKTIQQAKKELTRSGILQKLATMPTDKYRVVYADPPWSYNDKCDDGSVQAGGCERHYPTMTIAQLEAMPVKDFVEPDAVLFLWVTSPLLDECWPVIKAWGFEYKASFVWDKIKHNMGHYNSVRHELLLICTRGSCTPEVVKLHDSVQSIERKEHSQKPEEFRAIIDELYPHGKRIELFARKQIDGWDNYGNQC